MPKSLYSDLTGTSKRPRKKRGSYKIRSIEERGRQKKEYRVQISFWRRHKMDDIIGLTSEELDKVIDKFYEQYEKDQIKQNRFWWYPEILRHKDIRIVDKSRK